ncbi:hypothetical protein ACQP2T_61395 [Nonomuraea sp. CA-143628]|uniref:hypothetical protein n=1 Tax=Nonomuraea sp. CA-143628 TaxID=3239997 RepID=UPI003D94CE24
MRLWRRFAVASTVRISAVWTRGGDRAPSHGPPMTWRGDPVARLAMLGEGDMLNRRTVLTAAPFTLVGLLANGGRAPAHGATRRAGVADVDRIRATTRTFADLDDQYGGGHTLAVVAYAVREVTPLLHATTGRCRPGLFRAAAELSYLAAYMAMDAGATALAERYYIMTVRLANEAGDMALRATGLRSMAVQATELGHNRLALALADAAASSLGRRGPLRTLAWVTGMQAETQAAAGSRWDALNLLRRTEAQLDRADSLPEADWTGNYRRESFEHQTGLALTRLGDHATAASHFAASMAARRPIERRSRVLIGLRAAHAYLRAGDVDQAGATVLGFGQDVRLISSARVRNELRQLRADWQPYRGSPQIAAADRLVTAN